MTWHALKPQNRRKISFHGCFPGWGLVFHLLDVHRWFCLSCQKFKERIESNGNIDVFLRFPEITPGSGLNKSQIKPHNRSRFTLRLYWPSWRKPTFLGRDGVIAFNPRLGKKPFRLSERQTSGMVRLKRGTAGPVFTEPRRQLQSERRHKSRLSLCVFSAFSLLWFIWASFPPCG